VVRATSPKIIEKKAKSHFKVYETVKQVAVPVRAHCVEVLHGSSSLSVDTWLDRDIFSPGV
jgi:hypothetical protein